MGSSIHSDSSQTLRIGARRFESSPYQDCYTGPQTIFGVYAGRFYPVCNGEDHTETYWTLRRKAALYDVPERPVEIEGPDAVPFLERVFARRVATLKPGRGRYAIACTPNGGIFMDGVLFRLGETRFWYVQPDGALDAWLMAHADGFDVKVSDPKSRVLQVQGPNSFAIMHDASNGAIDESMGYFHSGFFDLGGQQVYVSRTGWTGDRGYEIYSMGDATEPARLWDHIMAAGAPHGMVFSSIRSMEMRRIEAGILDNLTDFDQTMTPFAAGLEPFIDLEKEGYVGRDALLKADRRPRLLGLTAAAVPAYRARVSDGDQAVGHVSAATWSPTLECGIGYVRFNLPSNWLGRMLTVETETGDFVACKIVELPFFDPEKKIPRGLA
ncbi:MAG: aminomethyltransferase family protein [Alphaproteobacteria bacterium]|nr:aminomethyltransferase family protein [Alphaproteobacteria bacterium]